MTTKMLQDNLWSTITRLAKESERTQVAVAYLGGGASRLLPLSRGDSLVLDMSKETVKSGQTNPYEVEKYVKKGVNVYTCSNLHAKVYVFDKAVIVGSANVSRHSKDDLVEAGLLCQNEDVVTHARGLVKFLQTEPVTPQYIRICKKIYTPPRRGHAGRGRGKGTTPAHSPIWLISTCYVDLSKQEKRLCAKEEQEASKKLTDAHEFEVDSIRWDGESRFTKNVKEGDWIVQVYHEDRNIDVYPPCRVIRITRYVSFDRKKQPRMFIHLEVPRRPHVLSWLYFKNSLAKSGLERVSQNPQRLIRSPEVQHAILGLWS